METSPSLLLLPGKADLLLAGLERQNLPVDFTLDLGDQTPSRLSAVAFPRQNSPQAHVGDSEEMVTDISENTTVTSADEEKLLLLNKNTELRRINKEGTREYYEQALFQELRRSQALQDYVTRLEARRPPGEEVQESRALPCLSREEFLASLTQPSLAESSIKGNAANQCQEVFLNKASSSRDSMAQEHKFRAAQQKPAGVEKEVTNLKVQLEALRCQTEIYKADYRMEQKDRQRIKAENIKLRRKEEQMRQQMALLEEQLKIFEDDFWRERSDKQVLQRLLKTKTPRAKEPTLIHRCNSPEKAPPPSAAFSKNGSCPCSCHGKEHGPCHN